MNQKSILFLFFLSLSAFQGISQIVSSESFDALTYPPTGWSVKPTITPTNLWRRQTSPTTNPTTTSHSGAAVSRFARNATAGTKQILVTRAIDYTLRGTSAASLDFWMYRDSLAAANYDTLTVWVNSTDTLDATAVYLGTIARNRSISIPDTQAANGWYHFVYSIPVSFTGNTSTHFIFEATAQTTTAGQGANIFIDDVSFDEFPNICAGTPNVGSIVNNSPLICGGTGSAALSLSAPITGILGVTYTWQESNSAAGPWTTVGTNATTLTIPTITATTFYQCLVNCSYSGLSYTTSVDSIIVSPNAPPVVVTTPTSGVLCPGSTGVQIIASGAATYSWSPAAGLNTTTSDTVIANPTANTQYIVTGTALDGCTDTAVVNVTLNAGPAVNITAAPNDTVCKGTQVVLTSVAGGAIGNIYAWSDGKTTRRDTLIVTSNMTLSVTVTNAAGCSLSDTIDLYTTPGANFGWTNTGNTFNFIDSSASTTTSWIWTFGDGNGSTNQNPTYTYSGPGTYTVTLVIAGTACNDTITKVIVVLPVGLNELADGIQMSFFPNPVQDYLNLSIEGQLIDAVSIRNNVGQNVLSYTNSTHSNSVKIAANSLKAGMYVAEISINGNMYPVKFIKQ